MAINPGTLFTGKIDNTDLGNYPLGKARNITTPGDGTGTPWVADLLNDIFGFQQAVLDAYSTAPSGTPETIVASQYLDNLKRISEDKTRYVYATNGSAAISYDSTNHMAYEDLTNVGAITVTMQAPVAPFGDVVTLDKATGSGVVTVVGAGGITIQAISGGTFTLDTDGQIGSLISKSATVWKFIK